MRFEVLTTLLMKIQVCWAAAPCGVENSYRRFERTYCPPPSSGSGRQRTYFILLLDPEDGGSTLFRNVGNYFPVDMV